MMLLFILSCRELDRLVKSLWIHIINPRLSEALETLKPLFSSLCIYDQDCFKGEKGWEALLAILPTDRGEHGSAVCWIIL